MAESDVALVNTALIQIGAQRINALTENSKRAILANEQYNKIRKLLLSSHPWNFSTKRVELGLTTTTPVFGFDNEFQLPLDVLRVFETDIEDENFKIEGDKLLTNASAIKILYGFDQKDTTKYSPEFDEALSTRLASQLAYPLVQSRTLGESLFLKYKDDLGQAKSSDGQEGFPDSLDVDDWLESRL